jgi:hypothetical protein
MSWVSFIAHHTSILLLHRNDCSSVFLDGCLSYVSTAGTLRRKTRMSIVLGDCATVCELNVNWENVETELAKVRAFFSRPVASKPLVTPKELIEKAMSLAVEAPIHNANRLVVCFGQDDKEELLRDKRGCVFVKEAVEVQELAGVALRHLEVGVMRVAKVPFSSGIAELVVEYDLGEHAVLCEGSSPCLNVVWQRVSRACMERAYRCAHFARAPPSLLVALQSLPFGAGLDLGTVPKNLGVFY